MEKSNKGSIILTVLTVSLVIGFLGSMVAYAFVSPATVNLGTAADFAILSKAGITNVPTSVITGNIGTSLDEASTDTAFAGITCGQVTGSIYSFNSTGPLPCVLADSVLATTVVSTAVGDMETAITDANSRTPDDIDLAFNAGVGCALGTCDLAGLTLAPGVYTFTAPGNVIITNDVTLSGSPSDIWIFIIPGTLDISSAKKVLLTGGAVSDNVFWSVAGATQLQTSSTFEGNILEAGTPLAMLSGATLHGRALSKFAVTLDANTVTTPSATPPPTTGPVFVEEGVANGTLDLGELFFNTVQSAIDDAGTLSGDTIHVTAGTYNESIVVNKSLTLNSVGAVINGSAGQNGVSIGASDVTVNGFEVTSSGLSGVYGIAETTPVSNTVITHNVVHGFPALGIALAAGSVNAEVTTNEVYDVYGGIYLSTGAIGALVDGNDVHDLVSGAGPDQGAAVAFEGNNTDVSVTNNTLTNNAFGLYVWSAFGSDFTGTVVEHNKFVGNTDGVENTNTGIINASPNWWGAVTGPTHATNPSGLGDAVSDNVTFDPWYVDEAMTTLSNAPAPAPAPAPEPEPESRGSRSGDSRRVSAQTANVVVGEILGIFTEAERLAQIATVKVQLSSLIRQLIGLLQAQLITALQTEIRNY